MNIRLDNSILKTLTYFDIFQYPLTAKEICLFSGIKTTLSDIENTLLELVKNGYIKNENEFYYLGETSYVLRRKKGNELANKFLKKAYRFSKLIASFPFVESIAISGSLSKNYMDSKSDIDYFIIAKTNRLWLCRTFLSFFKKIFMFNSKKYFCTNYFVDITNLEIPDKNIFTATEIITLIPTYNYDLYLRLLAKNTWTSDFFPNFLSTQSEILVKKKKNYFKFFIEWMLKGKVGTWVDNFCYKISMRFWKKHQYIDDKEYNRRFRYTKNVAKHHQGGFQTKVLDAYKSKLTQLEKQFDLTLV